MTVLNKTYTIELTDQDIDIITTALHGQYKTEKELLQEQSEGSARTRIFDNMDLARNLRNDFGRLIGRAYLGEDA